MADLDLAELTVSTGRIIRAGAARLDVDDATWGEDTAVVVLAQPPVRIARAALALVEEMAAEHVPVPRRPGSQDVVCEKCVTGWPCEYDTRLGTLRDRAAAYRTNPSSEETHRA